MLSGASTERLKKRGELTFMETSSPPNFNKMGKGPYKRKWDVRFALGVSVIKAPGLAKKNPENAKKRGENSRLWKQTPYQGVSWCGTVGKTDQYSDGKKTPASRIQKKKDHQKKER